MILKRHALKALETAKEDMRRDGYLLPVAFVVTDEGIVDFNIQFRDQEEKSSVYTKLVEIAKEKNARAIITINDAQIKDAPRTDTSRSPTETRDPEMPPDCIYLTVSGPGIQTWAICVPYYRAGAGIVFGKQIETTNDILNLLAGWGNSTLPLA